MRHLHLNRQERTGKERRLVWNNDGSDLLQIAYAGGNWPVPLESRKQFITNLMGFLAGTEVDSIFYCDHTNEPNWDFPTENISVLGPNPLQPAVDFAHSHGMEFFYSIRMNDVHASYYAPKKSYWPQFRLDHPELLLGNLSPEEFRTTYMPWIRKYMQIEDERHERKLHEVDREIKLLEESQKDHPMADMFRRYGATSREVFFWAGYDWSKTEVQDRYLGIIEEAIERYDIDGIELDWMRHPTFLKPAEESRNVPVISDFVHLVRQRTDMLAEKRGRPILIAMRMPDTVELALSLGLDAETWIREGWLDLLMAGSGFMPFSIPMKGWVDLCHHHDVPVYGCLDRLYPTFKLGRPKFDNRDPAIVKDEPDDYASVSAACHRFWTSGVDGIYLYDWHTHHGPTDQGDFGFLPDVTDRNSLSRKEKLYRIDTDYRRNTAISGGCVRGQLPMAFTARSGEQKKRLNLEITDDPDAASRCFIRMKWDPDLNPDLTHWRVNGTPLGKARLISVQRYAQHYGMGIVVDPGWFEYALDAGALKTGDNVLELTLSPDKDLKSGRRRHVLEELWIGIRYN